MSVSAASLSSYLIICCKNIWKRNYTLEKKLHTHPRSQQVSGLNCIIVLLRHNSGTPTKTRNKSTSNN